MLRGSDQSQVKLWAGEGKNAYLYLYLSLLLQILFNIFSDATTRIYLKHEILLERQMSRFPQNIVRMVILKTLRRQEVSQNKVMFWPKGKHEINPVQPILKEKNYYKLYLAF